VQADTIGGYVSEWLRRVPEPGEQIVIEGTTIEIESVEEEVVTSLILGDRPQPFEEQLA
jgi:CBS domain containing-hemolysin-like protein